MTPLGTFAVTATRAEVDAFRAATGLPSGGAVPLTFPMRWLADDRIRDVLMSLVTEPDVVPVHEAQAFDCLRPLAADRLYSLRIEARRDADPDRLVIAATLVDEAGDPSATLDTTLRLFSTSVAP